MTLKQLWQREKYVAVHGQTWRFRFAKYMVMAIIAVVIYEWRGWKAFSVLFLVFFVLAIAMHFFFRYKTKGWTESWGLYKRIPMDGE